MEQSAHDVGHDLSLNSPYHSLSNEDTSKFTCCGIQLRGIWREVFAEIIGTFVLISFGVGSVAQVTLSKQKNGEYLSINIGWALGVLFGIIVAGDVSGAHLNPAVTFALAVYKRISWKKVIPYILGQLLGAFCASAMIFALYFDALKNFTGGARITTGSNATASIWATYPSPFLSQGGGFFDQVVGTAFLLIIIFALSDEKNAVLHSKSNAFAVSLAVLSIGISFGYNCGYAINPARDFGPRLFTAIAGWGTEVFTTANQWWWIPIIAPLIGATLGGGIYQIFVGLHHP